MFVKAAGSSTNPGGGPAGGFFPAGPGGYTGSVGFTQTVSSV